MKTTALLATLAAFMLPGVASAMCTGYGHSETASMSCAKGTTYDSDTNSCVTVTG